MKIGKVNGMLDGRVGQILLKIEKTWVNERKLWRLIGYRCWVRIRCRSWRLIK